VLNSTVPEENKTLATVPIPNAPRRQRRDRRRDKKEDKGTFELSFFDSVELNLFHFRLSISSNMDGVYRLLSNAPCLETVRCIGGPFTLGVTNGGRHKVVVFHSTSKNGRKRPSCQIASSHQWDHSGIYIWEHSHSSHFYQYLFVKSGYYGTLRRKVNVSLKGLLFSMPKVHNAFHHQRYPTRIPTARNELYYGCSSGRLLLPLSLLCLNGRFRGSGSETLQHW
jgi:hypothetical protein